MAYLVVPGGASLVILILSSHVTSAAFLSFRFLLDIIESFFQSFLVVWVLSAPACLSLAFIDLAVFCSPTKVSSLPFSRVFFADDWRYISQ